MRSCLIQIMVVLLGLFSGSVARAAWSTDSTLGTPVLLLPGDLNEPQMVSDGAGGFKPTAESPLRPSFAVWGVATGDVNGDKLVDLVCGSQGNEGVAILLGNGKGGFEEARSQSLPAGEFSGYVALADFDKDGKLDIAAASYGSGEVTVFMNRTK